MGWFDTFKIDKKFEKNGKKYSEEILRNSIDAANAMRSLAEEERNENRGKVLGDAEWFSILLEFVYLYLHLTDRFAYGQIEEDRRHDIMTILEEVCIYSAVDTVCQGWSDDLIEKIKRESIENLFAFVDEYSKYKKLIEEKDESPKDTLFWEFSKNIAKLAVHEMDITFIMPVYKLLIYSLKDLDIKSFIKNVK